MGSLFSVGWAYITGGDVRSAGLKALRAALMAGGPMATAWLNGHGVDAGTAGAFVNDCIGVAVSGAGVALSIWDYYSVKRATSLPAAVAKVQAVIPPDQNGRTVIGNLSAAELKSLEAASRSG